MVEIKSQWAGLTEYARALKTQLSHHAEIAERQDRALILGFEHPKTITLGIRSNPQLDLQKSPEWLKENGFAIKEIRRGGEAVLHNPGQLVIYPILPLRKMEISVRCYVDLLQNATKSWLQNYGLKTVIAEDAAAAQKEPGLYSQKGKVAFFGIQVRRGTSLHGIAINIANDLEDFKAIRSCGVKNCPMDRLKDHFKETQTLESYFEGWCTEFRATLESFKDNASQQCLKD